MTVTKSVEPQVRYFETLTVPREACLKAARALLNIVGLGDLAIVRMNMSRQTDANCGLYCLHYAESELRRARGEAGGFPQWPDERRLRTLRTTLESLHTMILKEHTAWLKRDN